ncbi:MAG: pyrimidine/purine nucleoside phosphorylase [Polyangiaceae bacterium]|nr:pyrimidine/purine nucleoside phosphorylase [Polyangiaceae bacterium]
MLKHNTYFEGGVQSVGFERNGSRATVGVVDTGEYRFGTEAPERMTVVSGELFVRTADAAEWVRYPSGATFEIPGASHFFVRAAAPAAYLCVFL